MDNDWTAELADQLTFEWEVQLRPRWDGLTDQEYLWEPVRDMWNVRPKGTGRSSMAVGGGDTEIDFELPEPKPIPATTIAWRMGHLLVGVFGDRNATYFGGPPVAYASYDYPLTAGEALARLDEAYRRWIDGVRGLSAADLSERCREPGYETDSMAALVLHINREVCHHGAEINLLRDLYRWR